MSDELNQNHVQARQWKKWTQPQRRLFNRVFYDLRYQETFRHPKADPMIDAHWQTIRWNAAFQAAISLGEVA